MSDTKNENAESDPAVSTDTPETGAEKREQPVEIGGQKGPEPTRYGDWEKGGIISDF